MPDPANPFDQFDTAPSASPLGDRPIIIKGQAPVSPTDQYHPMTPQERQSLGLPGGVPAVVSDTGKPEVIGGDKTNYRPMTPEEKTANHLSPEAPWLMGTNGDFKLPDGYKPDAGSEGPMQKQQALDSADALVQGVHKARSFVNDAENPVLNTATGLGYSILKHVPATDAAKLDAVINQEIRGNIFLKRMSDMKAASAEDGSSTGGTGIGRVMQAEIPLITGAIGTLDPAKLGHQETLNSLDQIERSALRSKAMINGENPDDPAVQKKYGIPPLPQYPNGAPPGSPPNSSAPPPSAGAGGGGDAPPPVLGPQGDAVSGSEQAVTDPKLAAIAPKLEQYLAADPKKVSNAMILGFLKNNGIDDPQDYPGLMNNLTYRMSPMGARWRGMGGGYTVDPRRNTQLTGIDKARAEVAATAPAAMLMHGADALTAGNLDKLTPNGAATDQGLALTSQDHPFASLAGDVVGGGTAALSGEAALGRLGMAPSALRGLAADVGYGGATGAGNGHPLRGMLYGLLGSLGGRAIGKGVGSAVSGVTDPTVGYVAREAPDALTIGQAVSQSGVPGKIVKGIEDRAAGLPIVGDAINARRLEGFQKMNSSAFDKALEPIGQKAEGKFGEQAVQDAQDKVSAAFNTALSGKTATADRTFVTQAAGAKRAIQSLPPSIAPDVENHVDTIIRDYFDPKTLNISGENMQALLRDVQQLKKSYQGDPAGNRIGKALDQVTASVEGLFRRQQPDVMPQYDAAKQAFKRVSTLEDAVLRAKNTNGVFTPGQLGMADRANTVRFGGKHAAAAGKGEFQDFQRNMQNVLPNKVPDSGSAGRIALLAAPAALSGAGAGVGAAGGDAQGGAETGLTLGTLLALAYSRSGQRALTAAVLKRPAAAKAAGAAISKVAPAIGHGTGAATALGSNRG